MCLRVVLLVLVVGCVHPDSVLCNNGLTCPAGAGCDIVHNICVDPDALTACKGLDEAADCTFGQTNGKCEMGVCLVPACANNIVDVGEVCDDGGLVAGDGCSSDCRSNETCRNGTTDLAVGEACDDGNAVNSDGCDDTCAVERAQWIDTRSVTPPARYWSTMAYDPARDAIILFGGGDASTFAGMSDTWEWRGEWTLVPQLFAAPPIWAAAAAYDHDLGRVVVQGGRPAAGMAAAATYLWDGAKWVRGADGPPREFHAMAYDAGRKRVVLFGGDSPDGTSSDSTWQLDTSGWSEASPATRPEARHYHAMTYDPEHGVVLMFGGQTASGFTRELWSFDGSDWKLLSNTGPAARIGAMLAYDARSHSVIMFGGQTASAVSAETWSVKLMTPAAPVWTKLTVTAAPSARVAATMVPDGHGHLLLFGGSDGASSTYADTWSFDGNWLPIVDPGIRVDAAAAMDVDRRRIVVYGESETTLERSSVGWTVWNTVAGSTAPTALSNVGMAYDEKHRVMVAFGGTTSSNAGSRETWLWDGSGSGVWTKAAPPTPLPRATFTGQLVWDSANERVLLFGPNTFLTTDPPTIDAFTTALWSWDGAAWTKLTPATSPPPRLNALVGFDRVGKQLVMFGGNNGSTSPVGFEDTWVFDGTDWKQMPTPAGAQHPPSNVGGLGRGQIAWNPARAKLTMLDATASPWEWTGTYWEQAETATRPLPRLGFNLVPSFDGHGLTFMFGSSTQETGYLPWQLRWSSSAATESCSRAVDVDGDGKTGCADPDCWQGCTPHCPPRTTCAPGAPTCGDGTCDPDEDCYSCSDCTCPPVCGDFVCSAGETGCPGDCP